MCDLLVCLNFIYILLCLALSERMMMMLLCNAKADWTTIEKCWVTSSFTQTKDTAVFENHNRLFLSGILGVPRETGLTAASRERWVDNYAYRYDGGRVSMKEFRFGGEGSGLGMSVYVQC